MFGGGKRKERKKRKKKSQKKGVGWIWVCRMNVGIRSGDAGDQKAKKTKKRG